MNEVETRAKQQLTSGQVTVMELGFSQGKHVSRVSTHTCNTVFVCATNAPYQKIAPAMQSRFLQIYTSGANSADVIAKICEGQTAAQRELKDEVIESSRWLQYHVQLVFLLVEVGILVVDLSLTNATLPRIFEAAVRRGLPHAQSIREIERVRCLVRLLVVIRAVLRNTVASGVSAAAHDLRSILNVQRDLSDLADLTVLGTAIGLLRNQWQHPAMHAVVKAMHTCFPAPTPDGGAAPQAMLESHSRTLPAVPRSMAAVETVTLNMRTALAEVLLPHIVKQSASSAVRHDDVCAVLAALESTEIHGDPVAPPIVGALCYMPKTGQFALARPVLLNHNRDILLESVQEVLRLCVPTNCDCISILWPSRTSDDHFRVVQLRRPAEGDDHEQTSFSSHVRQKRRRSSSFRSSLVSHATPAAAAAEENSQGLSHSSSKLCLRWQRQNCPRTSESRMGTSALGSPSRRETPISDRKAGRKHR